MSKGSGDRGGGVVSKGSGRSSSKGQRLHFN